MMKGLSVTANAAGIESIANITSVSSTATIAKTNTLGIQRRKRRSRRPSPGASCLVTSILIAVAINTIAEDLEHEMPTCDEDGSEADEDPAENERAENAPEQNLSFVSRRDPELTEKDQKDEEVVDAQALLEEIRAEKFFGALATHEVPDAQVEQQREADPDDAPGNALPQPSPRPPR